MVLSKILLSLWITYRISLSQTGPNGQNCDPGDDDNAPDACPLDGSSYTSLEGTVIECEENFDCCLCESITCGGGGEYCDKFVAGGDSSAFFVAQISITGDPDDGASIECGGDRSCEGSEIEGTNIKEIKCGGDRSCNQVMWDLVCITDDSCKVECDGDSACRNSTITVENVETVICGEENSCFQGTFTVINPEDGDFEIECGDFRSCAELDVLVIIPANSGISKIKGVKCNGAEACKQITVFIDNQQSQSVLVEHIECNGERGCVDAQFDGNNVQFDDVSCNGDVNVCDGCAVEDADCDSGIPALGNDKKLDNPGWSVVSGDAGKGWVLICIVIVGCVLLVSLIVAFVCIMKRNRNYKHVDVDGVGDDVDVNEQGAQTIAESTEIGCIQ